MSAEAKTLLAPMIAAALILLLIGFNPPFSAEYSFRPRDPRPLLGWLTVACGAAAMIYSLRKRIYLQAPGALIYWKAAHVFTGYIFLALLSVHANGSFGLGAQILLWSLTAGLTATGIWGVFKQGFTPQLMTQTLLDPVYKSEVSDSVRKLLMEIGGQMEGRGKEFSGVYQRHILPFISIKYPTADQHKAIVRRLFGPATADPNAAVLDLDPLSGDDRDMFYSIAEKTLDILELRMSQTYQTQMNGWLPWHIILTALLGVTLLFHAAAAYYF